MAIIYMCPKGDFQFTPGDEFQKKVESIAPGYTVMVGPVSPSKDIIADIEVYYGSPSIDDLKAMKSLKWLHLQSAGVDKYTHKEYYANKDCKLTSSSGVYGLPIAEHILALFFTFVRRLHLYRDDRLSGVWEYRMPDTDFENSTVGIIGLGDIGGTLAKKCHALGARVIAVKNTMTEKPEYVDELYTGEGIDHLIKNSDFIALCLPNTPDTTNIITKERIAMMKPTGVIVNVGRGTAIDQEALIEALKNKSIGGAGLDVTVPEPLPADHELWKLDNCVVTSHDSGRSPTNIHRSFGIFSNNLIAYLNNGRMRNLIDFQKGY
ncbi:MAG: D-2-hydroxyacid dehydrogenase [Clostridia bacterium]|nr:D-2-hydroxyacid dehydrogenase [Clostridia bacterium]